MNFKKNKNYFLGGDIHFFIGIALALIGAALLFMGFMWIYIIGYYLQNALSIALIAGGVALAYIPRMTRSSDEQLEADIAARMKQNAESAVNYLGKDIKDEYEDPIVLGHYIYEGDDVLIRRALKDGRYHSSLYSGTVVAFRKKGVYVSKEIFSLISEYSSRETADIPFSDEPHAFVETVDYVIPTGDSPKRQMSEFVITVGGEEKIRVQAKNTVILDELCNRINDAVKYKK